MSNTRKGKLRKKCFLIPFYSFCTKPQLLCCLYDTKGIGSLLIRTGNLTDSGNSYLITVLPADGSQTDPTAIRDIMLSDTMIFHLWSPVFLIVLISELVMCVSYEYLLPAFYCYGIFDSEIR